MYKKKMKTDKKVDCKWIRDPKVIVMDGNARDRRENSITTQYCNRKNAEKTKQFRMDGKGDR